MSPGGSGVNFGNVPAGDDRHPQFESRDPELNIDQRAAENSDYFCLIVENLGPLASHGPTQPTCRTCSLTSLQFSAQLTSTEIT